MAQIKITDLNVSDSKAMEELTDEELLGVNGGGFWRDLGRSIRRGLRDAGIGIGIGIRR